MEELIRALIKKLTDAGLTAVRAFPEGMMPRLTKAVTAVGIREVKSAGAGAYAYLGMRADEAGVLRAVYGRRLEAEAFLQVWCPRVIGGKTCMDTAEQALSALSEQGGGVRIEALTMGPCVYDAGSDCFQCMLTAKTQAYLYAVCNEDETEFTDFILKGEVK